MEKFNLDTNKMEIGHFDSAKISKTILHAGSSFKTIQNGTRVYFHFLTRKCDENQTVIDDSKKMGRPMELVIGKKFKLEVWETIVKAMAIEEIACFKVDKSLLYNYPIVSKTLRDANDQTKPHQPSKHRCGYSLHTYGLGYDDLDSLQKEPCDLEFIIELLKVENEGEYERQTWQLNEEDRLQEVPKLKEDGNNLYKEGKYDLAAEKYAKALGFLDQLMTVEKPGEKEWNELNEKKLPLLLNYSQCKLMTQDYYPVIEHCSTVLHFEPENVKALFRRGKAHAAVWNLDEAKCDLVKASQLEPQLAATVKSILNDITAKSRDKETVLKKHLMGKLF